MSTSASRRSCGCPPPRRSSCTGRSHIQPNHGFNGMDTTDYHALRFYFFTSFGSTRVHDHSSHPTHRPVMCLNYGATQLGVFAHKSREVWHVGDVIHSTRHQGVLFGTEPTGQGWHRFANVFMHMLRHASLAPAGRYVCDIFGVDDARARTTGGMRRDMV